MLHEGNLGTRMFMEEWKVNTKISKAAPARGLFFPCVYLKTFFFKLVRKAAVVQVLQHGLNL